MSEPGSAIPERLRGVAGKVRARWGTNDFEGAKRAIIEAQSTGVIKSTRDLTDFLVLLHSEIQHRAILLMRHDNALQELLPGRKDLVKAYADEADT